MKKIICTLLCVLALIRYNQAQTVIIMEKKGGVYLVPCEINGLSMKFILDTGASDVSISMTEAQFMLKNGHLEAVDFKGVEKYQIANGELVEGYKINLKKVEFGGLTLYNVEASISQSLSAPLLLGQSVIERLGKIQLEGSKFTILNGKINSYDYAEDLAKNTYESQPKPSKSVPIEAYPSNADIRAVYSYSPIIEKPAMGKAKQIGQAHENKVMLLEKVNKDYYKIRSGNTIGYLWAGWLK